MMVEGVGDHRAHQADVVGTACDVRNIIGKLGAGLARGRELSRARKHGRRRLDEREPEALRHRRRQRLPAIFRERRLRVEQVHLAGCAFHEEEDDVLRLRSEVRRLRRERIYSRPRASLALEQARQCDCFQTAGTTPEKRAPGLNFHELREIHDLLPCDQLVEVQ